MTDKFIHLKVKRQDKPNTQPYWEEFKIPYKKNLNVVSSLMEIQKNPVNASGKPTTPVTWECNCMEEVCGSCSMLVNGRVRQACSALIDKQKQPIILEPMSKFPVVRDLAVDRKSIFDGLLKIKAWVPIDGSFNIGPGPRMNPRTHDWAYELSRCMSCGCCMEACPQFNARSAFLGPAAIGQVRLFNVHGSGVMQADERLVVMRAKGGITDCGNSQNCQKACPKNLPLLDAIGHMNRQVTWAGILYWLGKDDK